MHLCADKQRSLFEIKTRVHTNLVYKMAPSGWRVRSLGKEQHSASALILPRGRLAIIGSILSETVGLGLNHADSASSMGLSTKAKLDQAVMTDKGQRMSFFTYLFPPDRYTHKQSLVYWTECDPVST